MSACASNPAPITVWGSSPRKTSPEGRSIYTPNSDLDLHLAPADFDALEDTEKHYIRHYGYFGADGLWHLAHDDVRFVNHSKNPNIVMREGKIVALRAIAEGEELLQDYSDFEELRQELRE